MHFKQFSRCVSRSNQRVSFQRAHIIFKLHLTVIFNVPIIIVIDVKLAAVILVVVIKQGRWDALSVKQTHKRQLFTDVGRRGWEFGIEVFAENRGCTFFERCRIENAIW